MAWKRAKAYKCFRHCQTGLYSLPKDNRNRNVKSSFSFLEVSDLKQ